MKSRRSIVSIFAGCVALVSALLLVPATVRAQTAPAPQIAATATDPIAYSVAVSYPDSTHMTLILTLTNTKANAQEVDGTFSMTKADGTKSSPVTFVISPTIVGDATPQIITFSALDPSITIPPPPANSGVTVSGQVISWNYAQVVKGGTTTTITWTGFLRTKSQ